MAHFSAEAGTPGMSRHLLGPRASMGPGPCSPPGEGERERTGHSCPSRVEASCESFTFKIRRFSKRLIFILWDERVEFSAGSDILKQLFNLQKLSAKYENSNSLDFCVSVASANSEHPGAPSLRRAGCWRVPSPVLQQDRDLAAENSVV